MYYELESDREVQVLGIGILPAGEPVVVSEEGLRLFESYQGVSLAKAQFPPHVKLTAVVENKAEEGGV